MSTLNPDSRLIYTARELPIPGRREVAARATLMGTVFARRCGPRVVRALAHRRADAIDLKPLARPLRESFEELGGTFIKFGQVIASSPGIFGELLANEFRSCLDTGPLVPIDEVAAVIEREFGRPLSELFAEFDPVPVGRASIAVVHRARRHDGRDVAVKVVRPDIDRIVATDLAVMEPLANFLAKQTGDQFVNAARQQLDGLRLQIGEEIDLRNEARALDYFGELTIEGGFDLVVVPAVHHDLSGENVLTMDFLPGTAIDDLADVERLGLNPGPVIEQMIRGFFEMTIKRGTFHGDIHAGNLILMPDGRIGVIDWGIVGRLDEDTHQFFVRMLSEVCGDDTGWADVTSYLVRHYGPQLREAMGMNDEQLAQFLQMMITPILLKPFGQISFSDMMNVTQIQIENAHGFSLKASSWREIVKRIRVQRRLHRLAEEGGGIFSDFDRGNFLLGKQLMYFERYGRLYLADRAILSDKPFLVRLLREAGQNIPDLPASE